MTFLDIPTGAQFIDIFAAAILVTAFLIVSSKSLVFYVRLFALQSLLLGGVAMLVVFAYGETHILIAAVLTIILKAIVIPIVLWRIIDRIKIRKEVELSINVTVSLLICGAMVIFADSIAEPIRNSKQVLNPIAGRVFPVSIAIMLIGLFIMMSRKKAVTQIVGLLTMENGLFLSGLSITYGMPLIVEIGVFFDILVAALILGVFVFRINRTFDSIDVADLRRLRH
ncbi:MAG TPA: NADH-quinone oxidoreductase subunit K [Bacteroidota bacterium]|nr:NADH-quinone oxidoreductase subunit K [Bacteroidota bacterium]